MINMLRPAGAVLTLSVLLSACVPVSVPPPEPPLPPSADACGASGLQGLVGQRGSVLAGMTLPTPTRILYPDMAVTMDYVPNRLNIELDANDRIVRVFCS